MTHFSLSLKKGIYHDQTLQHLETENCISGISVLLQFTVAQRKCKKFGPDRRQQQQLSLLNVASFYLIDVTQAQASNAEELEE